MECWITEKLHQLSLVLLLDSAIMDKQGKKFTVTGLGCNVTEGLYAERFLSVFKLVSCALY